jgi:short-subunit dehydrogenase
MRLAIYQASKAALITAGEGWRLELAPLGVRVVTLVTGGVATKFLANLEPVSLPEDSYYKSIKGIIEKQEDHVPLGVAPEKYALDVLRYVERGGTGKIWIGGGSLVGRVANWLFPTWALVSIHRRIRLRRKLLTASCAGYDLVVNETILEKIDGRAFQKFRRNAIKIRLSRKTICFP